MKPISLLPWAAAVFVCAFALGITLAHALPPQVSGAERPARPLIGRVRTHDAILELTVDSVGQGGPAHQVGRGVAEVIADVERHDPPGQGASTALESLTPGVRSR